MQLDIEQREAQTIRKCIGLTGKDVLEVGCGDGRVPAMLEKARSMIAIDPNKDSISETMLDHPSVDFRVGNGEDLDFGDEKFDIVVFSLSLHHQDPHKALKEAKRVLKENGGIFIIEPDPEGEVSQLFWLMEDEKDVVLKVQKLLKKEGVKFESITVVWEFLDFEELCQYFFEEGDVEPTVELEKKFASILGTKVDNKPLLIEEKLNFFLL
jgi:ubiquinone/menaquinone biosynthesis C-methylase UbiE